MEPLQPYNAQDPASWPYAPGSFGPYLPPRLRPDGGYFFAESRDPDAVRREAFSRLGPNLDKREIPYLRKGRWPLGMRRPHPSGLEPESVAPSTPSPDLGRNSPVDGVDELFVINAICQQFAANSPVYPSHRLQSIFRDKVIVKLLAGLLGLGSVLMLHQLRKIKS